jgi:hydroxymethylglutaryl-CoA lyase
MTGADIMIREVGPRDGLQIEPRFVDTADKIALVEALVAAGIRHIEVSSFVSPQAVPALRDAEEVFAGLKRRGDTVYGALVPNERGAARAIVAGADELNFVMSASETHNRANVGTDHSGSLARLNGIATLARQAGRLLNATVATAFGCPFEGDQPQDEVLGIVKRYLDAGAIGITLADTTGMANPRQVGELVRRALEIVPVAALTLHFHNTRGMGLLNVSAAYEAGARNFDASIGGLGGCPFAPGASGNVCTEDLVNFLHECGIATGIELRALLAISHRLPKLVGHAISGQVAKAGLAADLHAAPKMANAG